MRRISEVLLLIFMVMPSFFFADSSMGKLFFWNESRYTLSTRHFDIIYSGASRETAYYTASFADLEYERICHLLNYFVKGRITVVITASDQLMNGFATPLPYNLIVFSDYSADRSEINSREYIRDLMIHELTHIVSQNIRSPLFEGLSYITGNYWVPNLSMPWFMLEGITVSFESLNGFGRSNDPAVKEELMQDIFEDRFKGITQATGAYDLYPGGDIYYHYGGLFNSYLQNKYGMDKYARLWHGQGQALPYLFGFVFRDVYGIPIENAWDDFKKSLGSQAGVSTNGAIPVPGIPRTRIHSFTVRHGSIYYADGYDRDIKQFDIEQSNLQSRTEASGRVSLSPDGSKIMVSRLFLDAGIYQEETAVFNTSNWQQEKVFRHLTGAAFYGKSIIGLKQNGPYSDLVSIDKNGVETLLLKGTMETGIEDPAMLSDEEIAFILTDRGRKQIAVMETKLRTIKILDIPGAFYFKDLRVCSNKILFGYNSDNTYYRLGVVDKNKVFLQTNRISGGVFMPEADGDDLYYVGNFSKGQRFMKVEHYLSNMPGIWTGYSEKPWDNPGRVSYQLSQGVSEKAYEPGPYLSPKFWLPYATVGPSGWLPDAAGIYTILIDPLFEHWIVLMALYNYMKPFADLSVSWSYTGLPVDFVFSARDVLYFSYYQDDYVRSTSAFISATYDLHLSQFWKKFSIGASAACYAPAFDDSRKASVYEWSYDITQLVLSATLGYYSSRTNYNYFGLNIAAAADYSLNRSVYKTEVGMDLYPGVIPLELQLYGAYSPAKIFNLGSDDPGFGGFRYPVYMEYRYSRRLSQYYFAGELKYDLWNIEIQQGLGLFPFYINRFYIIPGYRGSYLSDAYYQSPFLRLNFDVSPFYGGATVPQVTLYAEVYFAINTLEVGLNLNYTLVY